MAKKDIFDSKCTRALTLEEAENLKAELKQEITIYQEEHKFVDLFDIDDKPKPPETIDEFLKELDKQNNVKMFCDIVATLQKHKHYCLEKTKFKKFKDIKPDDFTLQDALAMTDICIEGKEITLWTIALLLYKGCAFYSILHYCYINEFPEIKAEKERKNRLKEQEILNKRNLPLTENEIKTILTYSHYSQQYWDLEKIIGRLDRKDILRDFCRILYLLQVENINMEIFDSSALSEFIDKYGKKYQYPPLYVEHIVTDSEGVDHCVKEQCGYDLSNVYFSEDECRAMLKIYIPYAFSLLKSIAVLMLARIDKEYIPQNDIEWTHISCEHIFEYYCSTESPLILAETEKYIRRAPSNWVYPKLKPLDKKVVQEILKRYETYDKKAKEMRITQISTLNRKWDDYTKQKFYKAIACLPYNDEREIAILVNEGYSIEEISNYYKSLKV